MPRSCSSFIQSEVACRAALRPLTEPAIWIAPPNSSSFSVSVVLPASGCEMIANVRRRAASAATSGMAIPAALAPGLFGETRNYTGPRRGGRAVFLPRMTRITRIYADLAEASANTALFTCFSSDGLPAPILPRPDPRKSVANPLLLLHAPGSLAEAQDPPRSEHPEGDRDQ